MEDSKKVCKFCKDRRGQTRDLWHNDEFAISSCQRCGVKFTDPQLPPEIHRVFYDEPYFKKNYIKTEHEKDREVFNRILHLLGDMSSDSRKLLDIGCGDGFFVKMASAKGWEASGLDSSGFAVDYAAAQSGLEIVKADAEEADLPQGHYDVITLLDIMPHLHNPAKVISKAKDALRQGGILCIKCVRRSPKFIKLVDRMMFFRKDRGAASLLLPHAFFYFEPGSLTALLEKMGFESKIVLNITHDRSDYAYLLVHPRTLFYTLLDRLMVALTQPSTHFLIFARKT